MTVVRRASLLLLSAALMAPTNAVDAQRIRPLVGASDRARTAGAVAVMGPGRDGEGAERTPALSRRSVTTSLSVAGGAVLGAWLGYFVSQLVKSDWEGARGGERAVHRRRFAFSGAALGAIAGYLVRPRSRTTDARPPYIYAPRSAREYLTRSEMDRAPVLNALDAIRTLRPEWLGAVRRDVDRPDGDGTVAVFVADTRIGTATVLAELSIVEVDELRLYDAAEASRRWPGADPGAAIEVVLTANVAR